MSALVGWFDQRLRTQGKALQLASITVASKDPAGGKIDRVDTGEVFGPLDERDVRAERPRVHRFLIGDNSEIGIV